MATYQLWHRCSPSVILCAGPYPAEWQPRGSTFSGCLSLAPLGPPGRWEGFGGSFVATQAEATLYIAQESTVFSSFVLVMAPY